MRNTRAGMPAIVVARYPMYGSAPSSQSCSGAIARSTRRASGPASAIDAHCSVMDVRYTSRSRHSTCTRYSSVDMTLIAFAVVVVIT